MEALCEEVREENLDDPNALPQKIVALLDAGFVEEEQCVFLSVLKKQSAPSRIDFPDRTAYECFVNHIRVENYLENGGLPPLELLGRGIALAREIKSRLSLLHGHKHFRIIVTFQGNACAVRFHTIRPDQEWVDKDGNGHRGEATAIFETQELEI